MFSWLNGQYEIRHSARARSLSLRVSPYKGLEIVIPRGMPMLEVQNFVQRKQKWILKQLHEFAPLKQLPREVNLQAIGQAWAIDYVPADDVCRLKLLQRPGQELVLLGDVDDKEQCRKLLANWLRRQAKEHLTPWFQSISEEINLPFNRLTIRGQQTRWGSCTREKNINLNYHLMLLPPELVRSVMVHELCHTRHLNHSASFWHLVRQFDPNVDLHNRALQKQQFVFL